MDPIPQPPVEYPPPAAAVPYEPAILPGGKGPALDPGPKPKLLGLLLLGPSFRGARPRPASPADRAGLACAANGAAGVFAEVLTGTDFKGDLRRADVAELEAL